ncbi:hypothetical protein [Methylocella tundrae]|uniref:hypothetical protein n=1 Tax=Methylocella tundrae TaxID=227605 RepID=UPI00157A82FE|nr:hypothetical protein [Methylocella tundrae]
MFSIFSFTDVERVIAHKMAVCVNDRSARQSAAAVARRIWISFILLGENGRPPLAISGDNAESQGVRGRCSEGEFNHGDGEAASGDFAQSNHNFSPVRDSLEHGKKARDFGELGYGRER